MSDHKRNDAQRIHDLLQIFPVVLILGVRQCGKTSLAKQLRPDWKYFDLENSNDFDFISQDYDFFFSEYPQHVVIDEAQELPELFKNLRGVIDQKRKLNNRYILTGSSSPDLIQLSSNSLAGRVGIVELGTFKHNEISQTPLSPFYNIFSNELGSQTVEDILTLKPAKKDIIPLFLKGGYPQPIIELNDKDYQFWMQNYFDTYINRDIRKLFPKLHHTRYRRFLQMLSDLSGTVINKAQLGRSLDINEVTIRDYLEIAHQTYIWRNIPAYSQSRSQSLIKMPKGILRDSGLCHYLLRIQDREQLIRSAHVGQTFEAYVIEELIKGIQSKNITNWDYSYYRTKHGVEVDLILDGAFGCLPIEIKFSSSTSAQQLSSLKRFIEQESLSLGLVINQSSEVKKLTPKIIQVPVSLI